MTLVYKISSIKLRSDKRKTFHAIMKGGAHVQVFLPLDSPDENDFAEVEETAFLYITEHAYQPAKSSDTPAQLYMTAKSIVSVI
jgi:hypothetical protein